MLEVESLETHQRLVGLQLVGLDNARRGGGRRPRLHGAVARVRAAQAARGMGAVAIGLARRAMLLGLALPRG